MPPIWLRTKQKEGRKEGRNVPAEDAYVFVKRTAGTIVITQDFVGCYGLYLFRDGDFWVLSNSFLYLVDALKKSYRLTLNKEFADHFLVSGLCAQAYSETLVNEISLLDRAAVVTIDIATRTINSELRDFMENTVDPDSPAGMALLDEWYARWTSIIRNLKRRTDNISTDLSGGFDSRVVLGLFLGAGIDMNEVYVHSLADGLHTHAEDLQIASEIADFYGFKLNDSSRINSVPANLTPEESLNLSYYLKLGFHCQIYRKTSRQTLPRYGFTGGGIVRDVAADLRDWKTESAFIEKQSRDGRALGNDIGESVRALLERSFAGIKSKYRSFGREIAPEDACGFFYKDTRGRFHFGKAVVEDWFGGRISLLPLQDSLLHRLKHNSAGCSDQNLLVAVIYDRYNKDLLNFEFEGGRKLKSETREYARMLNRKYPVSFPTVPSTGTVRVTRSAQEPAPTVPVATRQNIRSAFPNELRECEKAAFYAPETKALFGMLYPPNVFDHIARKWNKKYFPDEASAVVLAITRILRDCMISEDAAEPRAASYVLRLAHHSPPSNPPAIAPFNFVTARIDIKNAGATENDVEISGFPSGTVATTPAWYSKNGRGHVLESAAGTLNLALRCVGNGTLEIVLRGRDVRNRNNERIPVVIDFTSFKLNGNDVFFGTQSAWHDFPYRIRQSVKDGQTLSLSVSWKQHTPRKVECDALIRERS